MRVMDDITLEKVIKYNIEYQRANGMSPSYRDIMHALKLGSLATVQRYVMLLERQGRLERTRLGNIDVIPKLRTGQTTVTPLVGSISCGTLDIPVENIEESYSLPADLFGSGELFMLHTYGDSMIDGGINKGDLVVIRKQQTALDGEIVVACVEGETTLKRIFHQGRKILLHPENKSMNDIIVDSCDIQGVLVSCIKMY